MDIGEMQERLRAIVAEMEGIHTVPENLPEAERSAWTPDDEALARFETLDAEATGLRDQLERHQARQDAIERAAAVAGGTIGGSEGQSRGGFEPPNVNRGNDPWDTETLRFGASNHDLRARVSTGLERDTVTPDEVKTAAIATLDGVRGGVDSTRAALMLYLATGSEAYRSAFSKLMTNSMWNINDGERQAMERAQALVPTSAGGFAVPFTLDPTVIFTNESAINPFRRISRVVTTATNQWQGVTGTSAQWSWDAEAAEVSDDSITLGDVPIPVHKMQGFIPYSMEVGGDWANIDGELRTALQEGRDELEATAHWAGTGTGQPTGLQTALVAAGTPPLVPSATAATFAAEDVYALQNALPPRHRQNNPQWAMDVSTSNTIRQFDTGGGGNFWANLGQGAPETLLSWPWNEASEMAGTVDLGAAGTYNILVTGAFSRYIIVDRMGMVIENIPHLFGANGRPTGQRGLYAVMRSGANVADANAFRLLQVVVV